MSPRLVQKNENIAANRLTIQFITHQTAKAVKALAYVARIIMYGNQTGDLSQTGYLFQLEDSNGKSTIDSPSLLEGSAGMAIIISQISSDKLSN